MKSSGSAPSNDVTCIEKGYHWLESEDVSPNFLAIKSAEECQVKCQEDAQCNWFNWNDSTNFEGCYLMKKKGTKKNTRGGRTKGATGPKRCPGNHKYFVHILNSNINIESKRFYLHSYT